jgi:hypothetical protein
MNYQVLVAEAAEKDIQETFIWYNEQKRLLGDTFKVLIEHSIHSIQTNPYKFSIKYKKVRICFLKKFPFGIHYTINKNNIIIVGVFHTAINPLQWKLRKSGL